MLVCLARLVYRVSGSASAACTRFITDRLVGNPLLKANAENSSQTCILESEKFSSLVPGSSASFRKKKTELGLSC